MDVYLQEAAKMRERGVQIGDILICDEGACPREHKYTGKPHVRIMEHCIIDNTGPRFFIHGFRHGLVAYVPNKTIQPGTTFQVVKNFGSSVELQQVR